MATTDITKTELDNLLDKFKFSKVIRIIAYAKRFLKNARLRKQDRTSGPLTTTEIEESTICSIKVIQEENANSDRFKIDQEMLNLVKNQQEIYICKGRIQGMYPIYISPGTLFAGKVGREGPFENLAWGSWANYDTRQRIVLDTKITTANQANNKKMSWMY